MALLEIVQYEVQVFQGGHWHVRARYPRSDRDHAFTEARRIDLNESHPARVVRDVYDPQDGRSQESTVFMSDRAKAVKPGAYNPARTKTTARSAQKNAPTRQNERPGLLAGSLAFRATMAVGVGIVTALLITAIATWALTPEHESFASVLARSPEPGSALTLFIAIVLFSVFTMLRGPLGISRLARVLNVHLSGALLEAESVKPARTPPPAAPVRKEPVLRAVEPATVDQDAHLLSLSRIMLARFYMEAAPANAAKALEDSLGLRGLALYLSGAASELASHLEMPSPADLVAQISPSLLQDGVKEVLAEARALGAADAVLMAAGRTGMRKYLSPADERPSMAAPLVTWHKAGRAETQPAATSSPVQRQARAS
jgi:hypothetical protein